MLYILIITTSSKINLIRISNVTGYLYAISEHIFYLNMCFTRIYEHIFYLNIYFTYVNIVIKNNQSLYIKALVEFPSTSFPVTSTHQILFYIRHYASATRPSIFQKDNLFHMLKGSFFSRPFFSIARYIMS